MIKLIRSWPDINFVLGEDMPIQKLVHRLTPSHSRSVSYLWNIPIRVSKLVSFRAERICGACQWLLLKAEF